MQAMQRLLIILLFLFCTLSVFAQQPKTVSLTEQEQQAILQGYTRRQFTQQKLEEKKKLYEAMLQILQNDLKASQAEDDNVVMFIRNIELQIANAHKFELDDYEKKEDKGKLVYALKPKESKEKPIETPKDTQGGK